MGYVCITERESGAFNIFSYTVYVYCDNCGAWRPTKKGGVIEAWNDIFKSDEAEACLGCPLLLIGLVFWWAFLIFVVLFWLWENLMEGGNQPTYKCKTCGHVFKPFVGNPNPLNRTIDDALKARARGDHYSNCPDNLYHSYKYSDSSKKETFIDSKSSSQNLVNSGSISDPKYDTPWYRSTIFYLFTFLVLPPVWGILILTDQDQSKTVKTLVGVWLILALVIVCIALTYFPSP